MSDVHRYPELTVAGTPRDMGRQIGEAAREQVRGFADIALERVNRTIPVSRDSAMQVAAASIPWIERYAPDQLDELQGIAEAAGLSLDEVVLLQVRNQLQPDAAGGCSSLSINRTRRSGRFVAQNWDNDPALDPFTLVITRRPLHQPAFMTVTQAGLIAYVGCSDAGLGLCLNTLPAPSRPLGVPHYCLVRRLYEARSLDEAVAIVRQTERAIPANIMLTTPEGPADLEITLDEVHVLRDPVRVTHTNHCRHPDLAHYRDQFPEMIQSDARQARIDELLDRLGSDADIAGVQSVLRDHQDHPRSICRHANGDVPTGFWQTVFSVILEPEAGRMHLTRGTPCDHSYEVYSLGN